ncbi:MAG: tetratricopeptide repeat protein [Syntrophomonas sp.]
MYCGKCGQELEDDARFCNSCGNIIKAPNKEKSITAESGSEEQPFKAMESPNETNTAAPIQTKPSGTGKKTKIIIGSIVAVVLVLGGFWGWNSFGTEARMQAKLDLAVKYLSENDYEKAILAFNDAIKIDPKEVKAYQGLARVYTIQEKYDEAQSAYDRGLAAVATEKKTTLQIGLAGMYIDQGQLDKAEQAFQEINSSNSACLEAYFGLAIVYQQKGNNAKAEAMLRKAVADNPNEYRAYNTLALYLKQNNKTDDSFTNLVKSLSLEINQQEAYLILTDLYKGNWNALQSKASLIADQQLAEMLQFYGYYASEDYPKAITTFQEKLSQSSNQKARILAAIAMLKQGDKPGAEALVKQLTNEKLNDWFLSDLARYYLDTGDKDKAKAYALKALKANPTNLDAIVILQTINSTDASAKVYTAQVLLYNWKPVSNIKKEMQDLNLVTAQITISDKSDKKSEMTASKNNDTKDGEGTRENSMKPVDNSSTNIQKTINHKLDSRICYAASNNHLEEVKELLAEGADPNAIDDQWDCPLNMASMYQNKEMAKLLLSSGANVNIVPPSGRTPLLMALKWSYWDDCYDYVETLLKAGANVNARDPEGHSAVGLAETNGNLKTADLIRAYKSKR